MTLPDGTINYRYDTLGRTTKVDYSDENTPDVTYAYDQAGRPAQISNGATTATYTYDAAGRTTGINRDTERFVYDWDSSGRLAKRTLPDGRTQAYGYDSDARLATTTLRGGGLTADTSLGYTYDPAGQLKTTTRSGGPVTTRTYDATGRLTQLTHALGSTTLVEQTAARTNTGAPRQVTTTRGGSTTTALYEYDDAGAVTRICLPDSGTTCTATDPATSYTYDDNGNRTQTATVNSGSANKTTAYTYDKDDRQTGETTGTATTAFTFDANGSLATQTSPSGTRTFDYRLDGNLAEATLADGRVVGYTYDEAGNRTRRTVGGVTDAMWSWDTAGGLAVRLDEKNAAGDTTHQWWNDPTDTLGTAALDTPTAQPVWLLGDYQGTVTGTADASGLTGTAAFDPFGDPLATPTGTFAGNPLRFHGQYLDAVTGLYDIRARDYSSSTGRFTAPDPVAADAGSPFATSYNYGLNQPTVLTDPSGQCFLVCGAVGALVGAAAGGIDCALSGDGWGGCAKKVAVGAAVGFIVGATMGAAAEIGVGAWGYAGIAGLGNVGYGAGVAAVNVKRFHHLSADYDLTIEDLRTYWVLAGATPVLVHNRAAHDIRISPAASDWATKGAHMHIKSSFRMPEGGKA